MAFFIVLTICLLLLVSLLLLPIVVFIDTKTNQYHIKIKGLIKASFEKHEDEIFRIRLNILFINFYIYPLRKKKNLIEKKNTKIKPSKSKKQIPIIRFFKILRTFKVEQFFINIDSGNYILNAKLYPLFAFLNYRTGNFHINFQGQNELKLLIKNRPIYIIKSFINS